MNNTYTSLIGKHEKCESFILGAGPSLWYHENNPLFKRIGDFGIVVSVNSSVMAYPNFDYWISNDSLCRRWSWWDLVKKGKGIKIVRNSWYKYKKEIKDFLFFNPRPTSEDIVDPFDVGLSYCSSVPSAIDLSLQMGCKKIFLLGVDHSEFMGKHHFWQFYDKSKQPICCPPAQGPWSQQMMVFDINLKAYEALRNFASYKKAEIFNVSFKKGKEYITKIDIFRILDSDDFYAGL